MHKVTIIPHAMALGVTQFLPADDRHTRSGPELLAQLAVLMGGRAAEHLVFEEFTTGAADDIKKATDIARRMVSQWGMSDRIGPLGFSERDDQVFLGRDISRPPEYSEATSQAIDAEVKRIVESAWTMSLDLLRENRSTLERIASSLLERETLESKEFKIVLEGGELEPLPRPSAPDADGDSEGTEGGGDAIPVDEGEAAADASPVPKPVLHPLGDS